MIAPLASIFQLIYAVVLIAVGATGIFCLNWELEHFYGLAMDDLNSTAGATFLNQFRFLKAVELAFGLFCLLQRRDILAGGVETLVFLAACGLGAFARVYSWTVDGRPEGIFLWFILFELATFTLVLLHTRRDADAA